MRARAMVVDDRDAPRAWAAAVLRRDGWDVAAAADGAAAIAALARAGPDIALVLMDLRMPEMDGYAAAAAIRAGSGGLPATVRDVPILAFTAHRPRHGDGDGDGGDGDARLRAAGMDGLLARPCSAGRLVEAARRWRPPPGPDPLARLAPLLGAAEVAGLMARFRAHLAGALAALDRGDDDAGAAHRIAGIAGTLGFPDISAAWLAMSEGDRAARADARRTARMGLRLLDRMLPPA